MIHSAGSSYVALTNPNGDVYYNADGLAIARGQVSGASCIDKFGKAPDFDTADGFVTIYDGANDALLGSAMQYTYSATANIDRISSDNGGDNQDIEIQGLDSTFALLTQTVTLTNQTPATIPTALIRVFRMKNVGTTNNAGNIYCFVNSAVTSGKPNTQTNIRASIQIGLNQTLMAVYTIPAGKTGYMDSFNVGIASAIKTSAHIVHLLARPTGQVFQIKHATAVNGAGTSHIQHRFPEPPSFAEKTDIELQVNTDANAAAVSGGFAIRLFDN